MSQQHLALYRKYRPSNFDDVVGQENAINVLTSSIKQKKISHAYLFCGGRGTGKTTMARIFAREIGCNPEDIIEIDAASNRGIDEIRELRDAVRTAPFSSPYKVYIVDEAHMLTKEAANALLKTLEEPPSHVIFILATTDPEKLPATIVSRCQKITFASPDLPTLAQRLLYVAKEEGKKLDEESAFLIARHGKGSYRDALGVLEQVLSVSATTINHKDVALFIGQPEKETLLSLLTDLCKKDAKGIISTIEKLEKNTDSQRAYDEIIEMVREALLGRIGENSKVPPELLALGKEFPLVINSKLILNLLGKRHYLGVSHTHGWIAFEAVLLSEISS